MNQTMQNMVAEWTFHSANARKDPFNEIKFHALITSANGTQKKVPGFWAGGQAWKIRYSSEVVGEHRLVTVCSDHTDEGLHGQTELLQVVPYEGTNPLYRHGDIQASANRKYLEHKDGTPFFWMGDTWWMSLTDRLSWPEDFQWLTQDRLDKGFTVIQVVAGLYPDMAPLDERGANEGGIAWEPGFTTINPAFFDAADRKLTHLVDSGLLPCLVGCWGYYLAQAGTEVIRKHWEYLIARYGAYPLAWCAAGEALLPYYQSEEFHNGDLTKWKPYEDKFRSLWTQIVEFIKETDPFERLLTIHPVLYGHDCVEDASILDLDMLQTGHSGYLALEQTTRMVAESVAREPRIPVINSEVNYEGIGGASLADVQRYTFWPCVLSGACGHTYGANGIWQVNSPTKPYGASPTGIAWGHMYWKEAAQMPGSYQVGLGKKLLANMKWWELEPHQDWLEPAQEHSNNSDSPYKEGIPGHVQEHLNYSNISYMAGIPGQIRVAFIPNVKAFSGITVYAIEKDASYVARLFNPITGEEFELAQVEPNEAGVWHTGRLPVFQDWILIMENQM